jgi:DNA-binding LacI/PurR family transcriptional regulator
MQPKPLAIGVFTWGMGSDYYGAMISGIHQAARAAGVPLLIIQSGLKDIRLLTCGAEYVAGWIVLHPVEDDAANLVALVASGVPVLTVATALDDVACASVDRLSSSDLSRRVHQTPRCPVRVARCPAADWLHPVVS